MRDRSSTILIHAEGLKQIPYSNKPLCADSEIEYLSPEEFQEKFDCEYTESLLGDKEALREYLNNETLVRTILSAPNLPSETALRERLKQAHDGFVICYMGPEVGYGLFTRRKIAPGEILFLYAGVVDQGTEYKEGDYYQYRWLKKSFHSITAKKKGGLARFAQHLPFSEEKHKVFLKELVKGLGENVEKELLEKNGITLDGFINEVMANFDKDEEIDNIIFTNPTLFSKLQSANITVSQTVLDGIPVVVCWAPSGLPAFELVGYSYGKRYWENAQQQPRYFTAQGQLIPRSSYFHRSQNKTTPFPSGFLSSSTKQDPEAIYASAVKKFKQGEYEAALQELSQCLIIFWEKRGARSIACATTYSTMASCYRECGQFDEAIEACKQALAIFHESQPDKLPSIKEKLHGCLERSMPDKTQLYKTAIDEYNAKRFIVAVELLQHLQAHANQYQADKKEVAYYHSTLASCYRDMNENKAALHHAEQSYNLRQEIYGEKHNLTQKTKEKVAALRIQLASETLKKSL